jgi:cardiolipin synthase
MLFILHVFIQGTLIVRVLLRPHREPASRIAWIMVIVALPVVGILSYILFGETNIGRRRIIRMNKVLSCLPNINDATVLNTPVSPSVIPEKYKHLFKVGETINGFKPLSGNRASLMEDSNHTIESIVADIDSAKKSVHLIFYIWLQDNNGCKVVEALKRAAVRGVTCRVMADGLGSHLMVKSRHWQLMQKAGVRLAIAIPIGNPLLRPLFGRIDLRNHRKIVIVDNRITYCGSQNCADPEFLVKAKYAPWVDVMMRFEGPVVRQNQFLFVSDWMAEVDEDISHLLEQTVMLVQPGLPAQVIGTGPTCRFSATPEVFEALLYTARKSIVISTPYYVPNESLQAALCACAQRGVETTIIFPAINDSWIVGAASRSYYGELLKAGVQIFEYMEGLLHSKTLTMDDEVTLLGSANMDRRSFELNYENNIMFYDRLMTAKMLERQKTYILKSKPVTLEIVESWSWQQNLWNNSIAMFGPVL